jgi:hypothetical protein
MDGNLDLTNYFWMPSSIMQSVAAIYALFVAILVFSIQSNQNNNRVISVLGDMLKPRFKIATAVVVFTIYFNGLILFIFSHYKPIELEVDFLYFASLILLFICLIVIVYTSFWMISDVAGLKTNKEVLYNLDQRGDIEEFYLLVKTSYTDERNQFDYNKWILKPEDDKKRIIEYSIKLLKIGTPFIKCQMSDFLCIIGKTISNEELVKSAVEQLSKNLDDNDRDVVDYSANALGEIGGEIAKKELKKRLNSDNELLRNASRKALMRCT